MAVAALLKRACWALLVPLALVLAAPARGAVSFHSAGGLSIVSATRLDARLVALRVRTAALPAVMNIRILLPTGYAAHPRRRYPVLYLLHGTSGTASDWTVQGNAEPATAGRPLIVVMPDIAIDDGGGGWCTNWPNGTQNWETFHIEQLLPWVQANLRTLNTRGARAIAGLSQGGFCSISYAARHPDLFGIALAYSGAPDIALDPVERLGAMGIINATEVGLDHVAPDSMFGNPVTDYLNWAAHDPATLAANLRATKLYLYFGNGLPGPYDTNAVAGLGASALEGAIDQDNVAFEQRLHGLGISPAVYDPYGNGTHSWPYWKRDLSWSVPLLMADFAHPAPAPASFTYTTAAPSYTQYGWRVAIDRQAAELSTLQANGTAGFTLQGSGSASVTTPPRYRPRRGYRVTVAAPAGTSTITLRAPRNRRLTVRVPLGPSDTVQEWADGGPPLPSPGTHEHTTRVSVAPAR